ncbi:DoxX family protein [Streptomyces sp. NPDC017943]|uniref:DoxX family protein n=1 Tax=Streptomyces TaxID=1883 RepID=UPI003456A724
MRRARFAEQLERNQSRALGMFRMVLGLLFASEGAATLFGVLDRKATPIGEWPFWYAGLIELAGGTLVLLGIFTRSSAFICSGVMAFAYFTEHQPAGIFPLQNGGLSPALLSWSFLLLVFFGPGSMSISKNSQSADEGRSLHNP